MHEYDQKIGMKTEPHNNQIFIEIHKVMILESVTDNESTVPREFYFGRILEVNSMPPVKKLTATQKLTELH